MKIVKVLQRKDGAAVALGVFLAFALQGSLMGVADYLSRSLYNVQTFDYAPTLQESLLLPLTMLLIVVVAVEAWLWLFEYLAKNLKK